MTHRTANRSGLALLATLFLSTAAHSQLFRAYLAPTGSDASACTLAAPCRLLPAALAVVADGGEIWMLDSANYNIATVHVTKSVKILAVPGAVGSVVATGGPAVSINTAGVKVALRNLVIVPLPAASGTNGIEMNAGDTLTVEGTLIAGHAGNGIHVSTAASVRVSDSMIRDNTQQGLYLNNGARALVVRSNFLGNGASGILVAGYMPGTTTRADIGESTFFGNVSAGVHAYSANPTGSVLAAVRESLLSRGSYGVYANSELGGLASITVADSTLTQASNGGIVANGAGSRAWVRGNTVVENSVGFLQSGGALFESGGDNALRSNTATNMSGTITPAPQM